MYVKVRVTPGAKKERIERVAEDEFAIAVREPAEQNMANTRVRELIALAFRKETKAVTIVTGHHSRTKMLSIS